ncbi:hypothetical protein VIGAN_08020200, partial [Vigna angularis var. angularis]
GWKVAKCLEVILAGETRGKDETAESKKRTGRWRRVDRRGRSVVVEGGSPWRKDRRGGWIAAVETDEINYGNSAPEKIINGCRKRNNRWQRFRKPAEPRRRLVWRQRRRNNDGQTPHESGSIGIFLIVKIAHRQPRMTS